MPGSAWQGVGTARRGRQWRKRAALRSRFFIAGLRLSGTLRIKAGRHDLPIPVGEGQARCDSLEWASLVKSKIDGRSYRVVLSVPALNVARDLIRVPDSHCGGSTGAGPSGRQSRLPLVELVFLAEAC